MGSHYVPRQHLRRFAVSGEENCVWMYDKKNRRFCIASIASVAQERGYYDVETEKVLADVVEGPGKLAIDKVLNREQFDETERTQLSLYFMIMLTRGPRQRRKSIEQTPETLTNVMENIENQIRKWIAEEPNNPKSHERLIELAEVRTKFEKEIPQSVMDKIRRPFFSTRTVECILNMFWHVVPAAPEMCFVTSDTPAHMFECYGLAAS